MRLPARARAGDAVLALGVYAAANIENEPWASPLLPAMWALALAVRRQAPLVPVVALVAAAVGDRLWDGARQPGIASWVALSVAALIATYSVAACSSLRTAMIAGLAVVLAVALKLSNHAPPASLADI